MPEINKRSVSLFRFLLFAANLATFCLIVMGNIVRVSGAAHICPDWPTCFGQIGFPQGVAAQMQVIHRWLSVVAGSLAVAAAGMSVFRFRQFRWISVPLYIAVGLMLVEIGLGALLVWQPKPGASTDAWLSVFHLGLALLTLSLQVTAAVAFLMGYRPGQRLVFSSRFARLSLLLSLLIFVVFVSGAWLARSAGRPSCLGWPICGWAFPTNPIDWLQMGHGVWTGLTVVVAVRMLVDAWRGQRSQGVVLTAATSVLILLFGQTLIGALKVGRGFPPELVGLHAASAAALWTAQMIVVIATGLAARTPQEEADEMAQVLPLRLKLKDFWLLNKPLIVLLLLVTTFAGMVVGHRELPAFQLAFWTLLGGALAAGGASAINQYIDRDLDRKMQRTARRPLPSGRMMPAEGLAYGVGACLLSFFLMAGFVNLLAALLSLAGMVYYVLIYSIWLKRVTVQNIVIGGGAGAIPPLVGWAAATGSLNVPALFLFAIVFLWTPPHFWALAIVRQNDYARASIPMLPVIRGEKETRVQIFIYTLQLVGLTLLIPIFKIAGSLFLISAGVLGLWLTYAAWQVLRTSGNKQAWKMYRYSSMYLGLIFLALMLDALL